MANRYIAFLACVAYAFLPLEFGLAAEKEVAAKAFGNVTQARVLGEVDSGENWLVNGGRFTGEHFSPLDEINDGNAEELGLAWFADIPSFTLSAEPLVIDGVAYLTGSLNHVYAIDAATGEMLWQFVPELRLDHGFGNSYSARANRGVAVWNGMVYTGTADCRLIAIDAANGKQLWEAPVCDPTEGSSAGITAAPRVGDGKVFMGYAGSDFGVRGSLTAFDAGTGEVLWSSGKTGSSIQAAPVSYRLGGEQYVLVGAGRGGALGVVTAVRSQGPDARGPARLFAFKLGGKAAIPASTAELEPVPQPPARTASAKQVDRGDVLFAEQGCELCHGAYAMGSRTRSNENGAVPDLRYLPGDAHALWHGIVVGGSLRQGGMPGFGPDLSIADSEALRAFVIEQAWKLYEQVPGGQRIPSDAD